MEAGTYSVAAMFLAIGHLSMVSKWSLNGSVFTRPNYQANHARVMVSLRVFGLRTRCRRVEPILYSTDVIGRSSRNSNPRRSQR
jgi:hypothetical protein